jgi:murein DD-endopeptidase MepM/ murein hydrolase activator NlpD
MKKGYSIVVTSTDSDSSKHLFLSKRSLILFLTLVVVVIIILIAAVVSYSRIYYKALQAEMLQRRNEKIEKEFTKIGDIVENLKSAELNNRKIKLMLGIEKTPEPVEPSVDEVPAEHYDRISLYLDEKDNIPSLLPTIGQISRTFGPGHGGIDIAAPRFSPVIATASGMVTNTGWDSLYGRYVTIEHNRNYSTFYGHLYSIDINNGVRVSSGEVIGTVGSSGKSTSPHLHYEVRFRDTPVDPIGYIRYFVKL